MKKICLCVLPLTLLLAACSAQSLADASKDTSDPDCTGNPLAPRVSFDLKTKEAVPECVRARVGTTIVVRLASEKDIKDRSIKISPRDLFADSWLKGRNHPFSDIVLIRVPGKYDPEMERKYSIHEYNVEVSDKQIDPRIEVEH